MRPPRTAILTSSKSSFPFRFRQDRRVCRPPSRCTAAETARTTSCAPRRDRAARTARRTNPRETAGRHTRGPETFPFPAKAARRNRTRVLLAPPQRRFGSRVRAKAETCARPHSFPPLKTAAGSRRAPEASRSGPLRNRSRRSRAAAERPRSTPARTAQARISESRSRRSRSGSIRQKVVFSLFSPRKKYCRSSAVPYLKVCQMFF